MFLPSHKFIVDHIGTVTKTQNGLHDFLNLVLKKPARRDEFDEATYPDDYYEVSVWNKKINELPVLEVGDKVEAVLNFQGRKGFDEGKMEHYYMKQLSVHKLTKV